MDSESNDNRSGGHGGETTNAPLSWLNAVTSWSKMPNNEQSNSIKLMIGVTIIGPDDCGWFHACYKDSHALMNSSGRRPAIALALLMQKLYDQWRDQ